MKEKNVDFKELIERIDDLTRILKFISKELSTISIILQNKNLSNDRDLKELVKPFSAQQSIDTHLNRSLQGKNDLQDIEGFQTFFPEDLSRMLSFEFQKEYVIIKPKQYLGSDSFRRIAEIVREKLQGEYVSAGKDSHFKILRKN